MSKYTTEVRYICEEAAGLNESAGFNDIETILTAAAPVIFSFDFPIFDETYRLVLEKNILRHFYTREIGEETVGLWKLRLWDRLSLIMPYYNKLYLSETLEFNPLYDVDYRTESSRNTSNQRAGTNSTTETRNTSDATSVNLETWNTFSDTPQGGLTGVENETYLTDARHVTETGNAGTTLSTGTIGTSGTNSESASNTDQFIEHVSGKTGGITFSKALQEYRETLLRIDQDIMNELEDLFFNLW